MTHYTVKLTDTALAAITAEARYIAMEAQAPINAMRWLEQVWEAVDSLERWPRRAAKAEEDELVEAEIRQLIIGSHLLLFSVDDARQQVIILGLRHGHRLPRPDELSRGPDEVWDGGARQESRYHATALLSA